MNDFTVYTHVCKNARECFQTCILSLLTHTHTHTKTCGTIPVDSCKLKFLRNDKTTCPLDSLKAKEAILAGPSRSPFQINLHWPHTRSSTFISTIPLPHRQYGAFTERCFVELYALFMLLDAVVEFHCYWAFAEQQYTSAGQRTARSFS